MAQHLADGVEQVDFLIAGRQLGGEIARGAFGTEGSRKQRLQRFGPWTGRGLEPEIATGECAEPALPFGGADRSVATRRRARGGGSRRSGDLMDQVAIDTPDAQAQPGCAFESFEDVPQPIQKRGRVIQIVFPCGLNST